MSQPEFQLTGATPQVEKKNFINEETDQGDKNAITEEPGRKEEMNLENNQNNNLEVGRSSDSDSDSSLSDFRSGHEREQNQCTEFCLDCVSCFGLFDACCPSDGEGCLTSMAIFFGNIFVSCCKC